MTNDHDLEVDGMNTSCAFAPCAEVTTCALAGGCATRLVPQTDTDVNDKLTALNGTKPGRTNRDPALIKRKRKAIRP